MGEKGRRTPEEERILKEAEAEAAGIVREAEEVAREIYGASLEYVDDMLSEVNLIVLRSKEMVKLQMENALGEFDAKLDLLSGHKQELLELLRAHTEEGKRPVKKGDYEIKVDDSYLLKKTGYEVKMKSGTESHVEVHRPAKANYEIKIADGWKDRIESMLAAADEPVFEEPEPEEEPEEGYSAADFNLDAEYFQWLEEENKKG